MDGDKGYKPFDILSKSVTQNNNDKSDELIGDPIKSKNSESKTIIDVAMFAYVRIALLSKLSSLQVDSKIISNINIRARLIHVIDAMFSIVNKLYKEDAIKKIVVVLKYSFTICCVIVLHNIA